MTFDRSKANDRLDAAVYMYRALADIHDEKQVTKLRRYAGTVSRMYRPGHKIWNWFWDAEYRLMWPPFFFILFLVLFGGLTWLIYTL